MDIRATQAGQAYLAAKPAVVPKERPEGAATAATKAAEDFVSVLRNGEATAKGAALGAADPHALVMALSQTELAVETAATLRDKVVEAYQEILRMQV
ncbi:flagellar hook-basal body complex protein FliE [Tropicimonas sediminicola]|uniref:Flagellar hook-basal body complex protein FliE n=1 Tax=Tropicimonas sediminicola TaxID=1031541 RepID=A0A239JC95_9RHOB|nr:flagellar hook-basal body complex protein FliE [Tropicimonas sediminicola]SNT03457.1 flagellar hook-basal body complex protein FliE [Tropicimonas sediminicola]